MAIWTQRYYSSRVLTLYIHTYRQKTRCLLVLPSCVSLLLLDARSIEKFRLGWLDEGLGGKDDKDLDGRGAAIPGPRSSTHSNQCLAMSNAMGYQRTTRIIFRWQDGRIEARAEQDG